MFIIHTPTQLPTSPGWHFTGLACYGILLWAFFVGWVWESFVPVPTMSKLPCLPTYRPSYMIRTTTPKRAQTNSSHGDFLWENAVGL